uniref:ParB N-terminal domain-containing protein n=1 Tax=Streptomyces ureilyticus TaxID=1775131 RepID=UPI002E2E4CDE|nr:ParB N-terminal domain-containing protein [Streptomyces ureilyticus]
MKPAQIRINSSHGDIIESHPTTSLIPLLDEDELAALAHDIQENGLLQPIVLDRQGRILDGRARLTACERAGTKPVFVTFEGDTPDVYVLSVNLRRRSLTKGQSAMITVKARSVSEQGGRSGSEQTARSVSEQLGVALAVMGRASTVLQHAPDLVDSVISGDMASTRRTPSPGRTRHRPTRQRHSSPGCARRTPSSPTALRRRS